MSGDAGDGEGEETSDIILLLTSKPKGEAAASARHTNDTRAGQYIEHLPNQASDTLGKLRISNSNGQTNASATVHTLGTSPTTIILPKRVPQTNAKQIGSAQGKSPNGGEGSSQLYALGRLTLHPNRARLIILILRSDGGPPNADGFVLRERKPR